MADPRVLILAGAPALLDPARGLRRLPRAPRRPRPPGFFDRFEDRALVYDCFRHADGQRVLLVGPPPLNLMPEFRAARFTALPSGTRVKPRFHRSESVMVTELEAVPAGARQIGMHMAGLDFTLEIGASGAEAFAGRRILFTMSKDNELSWIAEWAGYHARRHGADAIVFFDNGSTRYGMDELAATLGAVPGIGPVAIHSWPWRYGAPDPRVLDNPFYTQFLQVCSMSVALRRYGERAAGLLNCDIDELVAAPEGRTVFDLARSSPRGLVVFTGQYVEPVPRPGAAPPYTHGDFLMRRRDPAARLSRPRKWVLDPGRDWVRNLSVHPYMHWIRGRPPFSKTRFEGVFYWHFKGISTGWKDDRAEGKGLDPQGLEPDPALAAAARYFGI